MGRVRKRDPDSQMLIFIMTSELRIEEKCRKKREKETRR